MDLTAIIERSQALGFLGPRPVDGQIRHASAFLEWLPAEGSVLDLGSGGGVPGLVLLDARPELRWVLLDANERRCAFLRWAVRELGLPAVVHAGRAEVAGREAAWRGTFDTVVARSFGPPEVTAELGGAFLVDGGHLVVSEPPSDRPDAWPADGLGALGFDAGRVVDHSDATVRVLTRRDPYPAALPRDERQIRRHGWPRRST